MKDTTGTGNTAPAVAVPSLLLQANLQPVDKPDDALNHDGPKEKEETTVVETCSFAQVETHLTQPVLKAVNGLEHLLVTTAKTFESENEEQSAIHTATHKASFEALATTIDNGRDAEAPAPTGSAEDKGVLAEMEQIRVSEDAPTNNDPNSRIEPSCEAHKLSPKTDLEAHSTKKNSRPSLKSL